MRHRALTISAITCIAALAPAGIPAAAAPDRIANNETFVMTSETLNGVDLPTHVSATGPIRGAGTETQTYIDTPDGEAVRFILHFRAGTVTAEAVEDYAMSFDPTSCTAKATGTGTWTIISGTGAYSGASGSGTFTDRGTLVGDRDSAGACQGPDSGGGDPKLAAVTLWGTGSASLPSQ